VRDAVGHDLRGDKGAPIDDIFFELSTETVKRPSCSGARVQVWCECPTAESFAIDLPTRRTNP
jgi:hypothetical protein